MKNNKTQVLATSFLGGFLLLVIYAAMPAKQGTSWRDKVSQGEVVKAHHPAGCDSACRAEYEKVESMIKKSQKEKEIAEARIETREECLDRLLPSEEHWEKYSTWENSPLAMMRAKGTIIEICADNPTTIEQE